MSIYEASITNPKKQLEFYKDLSEQLQQENKQLKEKLSVAETNAETFRLEMEDITEILGLDEDTLFEDVKLKIKKQKINNGKKE